MLATELYWVQGPWPGKVALTPRPRGGEWLEDEISGWRNQAIDTVLSLLTPEEETELGLEDEGRIIRAQGIRFIALPILDRQVPASESELAAALDRLNAELASGRNALIHCRQGVGRSGLVATCLLVSQGTAPSTAVRKISEARGVSVPETAEQRDWIDHYAATLASSK